MASSLADLLGVIDQESCRCDDPEAAAEALRWSGRLLDRLREDGSLLAADRLCDATARRLAEACRYAGESFSARPGHGGDLVAVTHDLVGRLSGRLSAEDRWAVTVRLAMPDRRWAATIVRRGPYPQAPELQGVADRAREVLVRAATRPARLDDLRAFDLPIPGVEPAPASHVLTAAAELVGELCRAGRDQMTMRELTAACHAAYQLAAYNAVTLRSRGAEAVAAGYETARSWTAVRETVALYRDAVPRPPRTTVTARAIALDAAVRHALADPSAEPAVTDAQLRVVARHLDRIATACGSELARLGPGLVIAHGPKPLAEERVGQWLRHETFPVAPADLLPALDVLARSQSQSVGRIREVGVARRLDPGDDAGFTGELSVKPL